MATAAPRDARVSAIARPIPRDPPVTSATRPASVSSSGHSKVACSGAPRPTQTLDGSTVGRPASSSGLRGPLVTRQADDDAEIRAAAGEAVDQDSRAGQRHRGADDGDRPVVGEVVETRDWRNAAVGAGTAQYGRGKR